MHMKATYVAAEVADANPNEPLAGAAPRQSVRAPLSATLASSLRHAHKCPIRDSRHSGISSKVRKLRGSKISSPAFMALIAAQEAMVYMEDNQR